MSSFSSAAVIHQQPRRKLAALSSSILVILQLGKHPFGQQRTKPQCLLGIVPAPSDYSEVKALTAQQIEALTLEEKKVLGFAVY